MNRSTHFFLKPTLVPITLLGSILLASCSPSINTQLDHKEAQLSMPRPAEAPAASDVTLKKASPPAKPAQRSNQAPQPRPQLAKTAERNNATQSVGELTTNLLRLGIWLIAYTPYLLVLAAATLFAYTRLKKQSSHSTTQASDSHVSSD